jgi:hypothetical protein
LIQEKLQLARRLADAEVANPAVTESVHGDVLGELARGFDERLYRDYDARIAHLLRRLYGEYANVRADINEHVTPLQKSTQGRKLRFKRVPKNVNPTASPTGAIVSGNQSAVLEPRSQEPIPWSNRHANFSEKYGIHTDVTSFV